MSKCKQGKKLTLKYVKYSLHLKVPGGHGAAESVAFRQYEPGGHGLRV